MVSNHLKSHSILLHFLGALVLARVRMLDPKLSHQLGPGLDVFRLQSRYESKQHKRAEVFSITLRRRAEAFSQLGSVNIGRNGGVAVHDEIDISIIQGVIIHLDRRQNAIRSVVYHWMKIMMVI